MCIYWWKVESESDSQGYGCRFRGWSTFSRISSFWRQEWRSRQFIERSSLSKQNRICELAFPSRILQQLGVYSMFGDLNVSNHRATYKAILHCHLSIQSNLDDQLTIRRSLQETWGRAYCRSWPCEGDVPDQALWCSQVSDSKTWAHQVSETHWALHPCTRQIRDSTDLR